MRITLPLLLIALSAACSTPAPAPEAPAAAAPAAEPPAIQTTSVAAAAPPPAPSTPAVQPSPPPPLPASLSYAQIEKTFGHHRRFFYKLYADHLKVRPKLQGEMVVSFAVNPDGTAHDAKLLESTLGDSAFEQAVLKRIDETSFPPATGPTTIARYPLQFSPQPK